MALYAIVRSLFSEEKAATVVSMQFLCIILNTVSSICNGGFCKFITDLYCTSFLIFLQKVPPLQCEYLHIQDFEGKSIINVYLLAMKNEKVGTFCEVQKCEQVVSNNTTISTGSKWKTLYTAQQYYSNVGSAFLGVKMETIFKCYCQRSISSSRLTTQSYHVEKGPRRIMPDIHGGAEEEEAWCWQYQQSQQLKQQQLTSFICLWLLNADSHFESRPQGRNPR